MLFRSDLRAIRVENPVIALGNRASVRVPAEFTLELGKSYLWHGPNGAGKTSLALALAGLLLVSGPRAVTAQATEPLLHAVGVKDGTRLLEVACGPGHVAAAAMARGATATGIDLVPGMIGEAHRAHPGIEFREGDAEALLEYLFSADGDVNEELLMLSALKSVGPERFFQRATA